MKELGFTLVQVADLLAEGVEAAELRGMLRLRRRPVVARCQSSTELDRLGEAALTSATWKSRWIHHLLMCTVCRPERGQLPRVETIQYRTYRDMSPPIGDPCSASRVVVAI